MSFQDRDLGSGGLPRLGSVGDEFTETEIGFTSLGALTPQVSARRLTDLGSTFGRISQFAAALAVGQRPGLLHKVGRIGGHGPFVSIGANLSIDVQVIQKHEFVGQGVLIRGDLLAKDAQIRIPIPFGYVAKELIVRPVFFDNVKAVLDGARITDLGRNRILWAASSVIDFRVGLQRNRLERQSSHRSKLLRGGCRDRTESALEQPSDVFGNILGDWLAGVRSVAIVLARHPFAVGYIDLITIFGEFDVGWIPTHWDES